MVNLIFGTRGKSYKIFSLFQMPKRNNLLNFRKYLFCRNKAKKSQRIIIKQKMIFTTSNFCLIYNRLQKYCQTK